MNNMFFEWQTAGQIANIMHILKKYSVSNDVQSGQNINQNVFKLEESHHL
jgi:hypothetical protein